MNNKLVNLSSEQKKAVVGLACMIYAQAHGGRFRTNDPETDHIINECFTPQWNGFWDLDYRNLYLYEAATSDAERNIVILSELDILTKYAVKNLFVELIGDNVNAMLVAANILQKIGIQPTKTTPSTMSNKVEKNTQEDDGTYDVKAVYARLADINAIRESNTVFTLKDNDVEQGIKVGANYNVWKENEVCPAKGLVGFYDPQKNVTTDEGTICFLICTKKLVIPVLMWGLEKIDKWEYEQKRQNNEILSYDKSGRKCVELQNMEKVTKPYKSSVNPSPDKTVIRFLATIQERFEPGKYFPRNYIQRVINLTYTQFGSHLELEVVGVMRPRNAKFENDDGNVLTYRDNYNDSIYYEVETQQSDNTIIRVSIFQPNENSDYIEYRYTI